MSPSKLGVHGLGGGPVVLGRIGKWVNANVPANLPANVTAIFRRVENPDNINGPMERNANPEAEALAWVNRQMEHIQHVPKSVWIEGPNECNSENRQQAEWYGRFELERMKLMEARGYKCGVLCAGTGRPPLPLSDPTGVEVWSAFLPMLRYAKAHGHLLCIHEYEKFSRGPDGKITFSGWNMLRYRKAYAWLPLDARPDLYNGEWGIDGDEGTFRESRWRDSHPNPDAQYFEMMKAYDLEMQKDGYARGFCVFTGPSDANWGRFDIAGQPVVDLMRAHIQASETTPVPPDPPTAKPYKLLPVPWEGVVDVAGVVNLRDLRGTFTKQVGPGTKFSIHSEPFGIPGLPDLGMRLLVNRETEWNVLADRIDRVAPEPPHTDAPLIWPTEYRFVTQPWGVRPEVYQPLGVPAHEGIDMRAPKSSRIFAAGDGVVTRVDANNTAYGVSIRHSWKFQGRTFELVYAHGVSGSVRFKVGDAVKAGDVLMLADSTGNVDGAHLHFSMKEPGVTYTDKDAQGRDRVWPFSFTDPTPFLPKV